MGNISIENASYLQALNEEEKVNTEKNEELSEFELDSIEKVSPSLFSEDDTINSSNSENQENNNQKDGEPSLFDDVENTEEDYEIPAFLRRQKN
mgnify:FL=1